MNRPGKTRRRPWLAATLVLVLVIAAASLAMLAISRTWAMQGESVTVALTAAPPAAAYSGAPVDYARLEARIALLMQQPDMVGLAVGTIENGRVRFTKGYGETRANSGDRVTPDTVFRWASLSKSVASAVVVGLAQDGKLSLAAPLSRFGTTLTLPGGATARVSVVDLLSHRLGLPRNAWDDRLEAGEAPQLLRAGLASVPLSCPPATCYSYQNIAYDTASEIVERVSGTAYANVARDRLFVPLGMTSATIGRTGLEASPSWARPHRGGRREVVVGEPYYRVPAAGGVNSSIRDLLRWMDAQMGDRPDVVSPTELAILHVPRVPTPPHGRRGAMDRALQHASYGLGWRTYDYAGHQLVGHRGSVDGYGALILFDPALRSGIVMLWNSNHSRAASLQLEFFDQLYGLPATDWLALSVPPPVIAAADTGPVIAGTAPAGRTAR